jgi:hypothetical protein
MQEEGKKKIKRIGVKGGNKSKDFDNAVLRDKLAKAIRHKRVLYLFTARQYTI